MPRKIHYVAVAFATLMVCSLAGAQMRSGASAIGVSSMHVVPAARFSPGIPSALRQARLVQVPPTVRVISGFTPFSNSIRLAGANGVPGLGFDYAHLAAIGGGIRNGRHSNFAPGGRRGQAGYVPIVIGAYPYYDYGSIYGDATDYGQIQYQPQTQQQPQILVIQQPVPLTPQVANSGSEALASSAPGAAEPVHDAGEFILIRRDGRILFASAFSVADGQLIYITPEGIRHTLPMTELDADATQQMNEARGTTVQIHK
jgi:hypothetical protein